MTLLRGSRARVSLGLLVLEHARCRTIALVAIDLHCRLRNNCDVVADRHALICVDGAHGYFQRAVLCAVGGTFFYGRWTFCVLLRSGNVGVVESQRSCYLMLRFDEEQIPKAVLGCGWGCFYVVLMGYLSCWRAHPLGWQDSFGLLREGAIIRRG
ncbi:hypothetical protein B0T16DRAFT_414987 [Cercophora newfieldiana]|uniref:Uncharacterized protein n=1 Tax=Cercophora newfieldiana TaxID=92897 RepID=A0AA40CLJ7_9PEZI|nr:hypothetical protein B0T16DRAFT_414987 [Cercophora newfieldiana]